MKKIVFFALTLILAVSCNKNQKETFQLIKVKKATTTPVVNGIDDDECWKHNPWLPLNQKWIGDDYTEDDFQGKFKLSWTEEALYILVEIKDDTLFDQYEDPLHLWWDDDCVEVFVDEDNSGGEHQYNHNAFAYHVSLSGDVVDIGPGEIPHLYNDHVISKRVTKGNTSMWELKVYLYDDSFVDGEENSPVTLKKGKEVGFALAYCDNDGSKERENFIGSIYVPGEDKNKGWIDANIFGTLLLEE